MPGRVVGMIGRDLIGILVSNENEQSKERHKKEGTNSICS